MFIAADQERREYQRMETGIRLKAGCAMQNIGIDKHSCSFLQGVMLHLHLDIDLAGDHQDDLNQIHHASAEEPIQIRHPFHNRLQERKWIHARQARGRTHP